MLLTQLEYFVALAREKHFGRAATACFVSPSALSEAIRKLEIEMGVPLVQRDRTFEGLTPEGEQVLLWAGRILADHRALLAEVSAAQDALSGSIRIGAIPAATAGVTGVLAPLLDAHPALRVRCESNLTSDQVTDRIRRFELDAGFVHPTGIDASDLTVVPLYRETLVVIAGADVDIPDDVVTAESAATLPLCLLEPAMGARKILDATLAEHGITLDPRMETDSIEELIALTRQGAWASIVPESFVRGNVLPARVRPLVEPSVAISIALVTLAEQPRSAYSRAITTAAREASFPLIPRARRS